MVHMVDIRHAVRLLRRNPLFTLLTVIVLSGGLGVSIFTFSFLYTAMLKPLPLSGGGDLVRIQQTVNGSTGGIDAADAALLRPALRTLTDVGAFTDQTFVLGEGASRRALQATIAEWSIFEVTRTRPLLGRTFVPEDQNTGAAPVIVLSHRAWTALFGRDPAMVDRTIVLNGTATRVIGVMPDGYGFPVASEAWVPLGDAVLASSEPGEATLELYGRVADGANREQARAEVGALLERARRSRVTADDAPRTRVDVVIRSFPMAQFGDEGPLLFATLNVLAALVLLLAGINVTNLLLARANERARETAVRLALGASRARLIVQNMWETVLLCLLGGGVATALAAWGLSAINAWAHANLGGNLAFWWVWRLDRAGVIAAAAFVTITIALLGGVVSARAAGMGFADVLRDAGARSGRREGRTTRALVVTQIATVSVLMFFGVMTGIVAYRAANIDPGYDTRNLLSASVALPESGYDTRARRAAFYLTIADELEHASALQSALLRSPIADMNEEAGGIEIDDGALVTTPPRAYVQAVLGPLRTLGIEVQSGRPFDRQDDERGAPVAIVSRAFADKHWSGRPAVGQRVRLPGLGNESEARVVVGVVSNLLLGNPLSRRRSADAIYIPLAQSDAAGTSIVLAHRGDAVAAQAALHEALAVADPDLPPPHVTTHDDILAQTTLLAKSVMWLFAGCFGFALLLAVSGTYGLMARAIGRRTREIGIRRALGATDPLIVRLILAQGGRQLGLGVLVAAPVMLVVGLGFWRFFPIALAVSLGSALMVAATIVSVVLLATYLPTRRVLRTTARDALWQD